MTESPAADIHASDSARRVAAQACCRRSGTEDTRTLTRFDEAGFRASVPRTVGGLAILAVSRYRPGGEGYFASAVAVAEGDPGGFSTHQVGYDDERDQWFIQIGHYLFQSRDEADRDAAERVAW